MKIEKTERLESMQLSPGWPNAGETQCVRLRVTLTLSDEETRALLFARKLRGLDVAIAIDVPDEEGRR